MELTRISNPRGTPGVEVLKTESLMVSISESSCRSRTEKSIEGEVELVARRDGPGSGRLLVLPTIPMSSPGEESSSFYEKKK